MVLMILVLVLAAAALVVLFQECPGWMRSSGLAGKLVVTALVVGLLHSDACSH